MGTKLFETQADRDAWDAEFGDVMTAEQVEFEAQIEGLMYGRVDGS